LKKIITERPEQAWVKIQNIRMRSSLRKINPTLWQILCLAVSILFFGVILLNRSPIFLRPLSMALRTGFGLVIPAAIVFVYFAFRIRGRLGELAGVTITLSLFAMPLAGLWASGQTQTTVLSGLIPLYDAESYYLDALGLINGTRFSIFSARRPLFSGLLAVLLSITDHNLMASLAILTGIVGLSCYFTAREIQRSHGAEAAVAVLMILFLFYRAHSGVSMSENLGVALGTLGFGLLWRGTTNKSIGNIWMGLLTTTLALNARAGAFFMLPLLILWAGWFFRETKLISWKALFISASAVILGFGLNLALTRLVAVPSGVPFANFSYTLYGLASGGKSWVYVFEAHPEVLAIQEPEQSKKIYQLAFELIREKPWQMVQGALYNWKMLFSNTWYNVYSYVGGENWMVNVIARWGMYLLCILGFLAWIRDRKDPIHGLVMACVLGLLISVPFLPPTDAYRMRPYAASIVIFGALPAIGLTLLLKQTGLKLLSQPGMDSIHPFATTIFSTALILAALAGPIIIKSAASKITFTPLACPFESDFVHVRFDKGTFVNIQKQNQSFLDWMPDYHLGLFRKNAHSLAENKLIQWAQTIEPPRTIFLTLDYHAGQKVMVVAPTSLLPHTGTFIQICGQYENDPILRSFGIFYTDSLQVLSP
jgi:hypothetical protein